MPRRHLPQCLHRTESNGELVLSIDDVISVFGEDPFWGDMGISGRDVQRALAESDADRIKVIINSPGGDTFEGIQIFNALRSDSRNVEVVVRGLAASAASIVAMAGDTVSMEPGSMMMIHNPWTSVFGGEADDFEKTANMLRKIQGSMVEVYQTKVGDKTSAEDIQAAMDAETWMTSSDAIEMGFADAAASTGSAPVVASIKPGEWNDRRGAMLTEFHNLPGAASYGNALGWTGRAPDVLAAATARARTDGSTLLAALKNPPRGPTPPPRAEPGGTTRTTEDPPVNREQMIAMLGLPADATDEQIKAKFAENAQAGAALQAVTTQLTQAQANEASEKEKREAAEATSAKAAEDAHKVAASSFIDGALAEGRITVAARSEWEALCSTPAGLETAKPIVAKMAPLNGPGDQARRANAAATAAAVAAGTPSAALASTDEPNPYAPVMYQNTREGMPFAIDLSRLAGVTSTEIAKHQMKLRLKAAARNPPEFQGS